MTKIITITLNIEAISAGHSDSQGVTLWDMIDDMSNGSNRSPELYSTFYHNNNGDWVESVPITDQVLTWKGNPVGLAEVREVDT